MFVSGRVNVDDHVPYSVVLVTSKRVARRSNNSMNCTDHQCEVADLLCVFMLFPSGFLIGKTICSWQNTSTLTGCQIHFSDCMGKII